MNKGQYPMTIPDDLQESYAILWGCCPVHDLPTRYNSEASVIRYNNTMHILYYLRGNRNVFHGAIKIDEKGKYYIHSAENVEKALGIGCLPVLPQLIIDDLGR